MKLLFTHSYFMNLDPKERRAGMPYAPLGTLYAAAVARSLGHQVALFDSMLARDETEFTPAVERFRPDAVVLCDDDFNYLTKMCLGRMQQAALAMIGDAARAGLPVIVHGSDPADHTDLYLSAGAGHVIIGEPEQTLAELLAGLSSSPGAPPVDAIDGLAFRRDGRTVRTRPRQVMKQPGTLPAPARDLLDVNAYRTLWKARHGYFSVNIVTTRGCPYHCNWCAKPIYGQVYNARTPSDVVDEMIGLRNDWDPDHLWFCDDIFGLRPGWVEEFAALVASRGAGIPFKCLSRADLVASPGPVAHLADAGCRTVWIGAESGSQKILDAMEKGTTVAEIRSASKLLRERGIRVGFFIQYGYPGETVEDIRKTLGMIADCLPDEIGISVSYPLPGTRFHDRVKKDLGRKTNWTDSGDLAMLYRGPFSTDVYRVLHRLTHKKLRIWQGLRLLSGRNPNGGNLGSGNPANTNGNGSAAGRPSHNPGRQPRSGAPERSALRSAAAAAWHAVTLPAVSYNFRRKVASELSRGTQPQSGAPQAPGR